MDKRLLLALSLLVPACLPDVHLKQEAETGAVVIDSTTGVVPVPFDLLKDPQTGLMAFPIDTATDAPLTDELFENFNRLDGFVSTINIRVPLDFTVDPATLTPDNVALVDMTDPTSPALVPADSYFTLFNFEQATTPPFYLTLVNKAAAALQAPASFRIGGKYILLLGEGLGGTKDGVPVTLASHVLFHLIKSAVSLFDGTRLKTDILGSPQDPTVLGLAMNLEAMRQLASALFQDPSFVPATFPAVIPFSIRSNPEALFLPGALGGIVPAPNDLTHDAPSPANVTLTALCDAPVAGASLDANSVRLYKLGDFSNNLIGTVGVSQPDATGIVEIAAAPAQALEPNMQYLALITSDASSPNGRKLAASTYFALARAQEPLLTCDAQGNCTLASPLLDENLVDVLVLIGLDPAAATPDQINSAHSLLVFTMQQLEQVRQGYAPLFQGIEAGLGIPLGNIVLLWTFTTGS